MLSRWVDLAHVWGLCIKLYYLRADMKGIHKMRLTAISPYRKKATAVHWRVIVTVIL